MTNQPRSLSLDEFIKKVETERNERLKNGIQTNKHILTFHKSNLTIKIKLKSNQKNFYVVDLKDCIDARSLLHLIDHLHGKRWDDDREVIHAFLTLFDDILVITFTHPSKRIITTQTLADGLTLNWKTKTTKFPNEQTL